MIVSLLECKLFTEEQVMNLLQDYIEHLKTGEATRIAALFAEDGEFYDDAPGKLGAPPIDVKGRNNIEAFFRQTFVRGGLEVTNIGINGNAIRYDVHVGGMVLLCLGVAGVKGRLIKQYRVTAV